MINQAHNIKLIFRPPFQLELHRRGPLGALVTGWVTLVHRRANRVLPVYSLGCLHKVQVRLHLVPSGKEGQKKACRSLSGPSVREDMFARTDLLPDF